MYQTKERSSIAGRNVRPFAMDAAAVGDYQQLQAIGINLTDRDVRRMMAAMDSAGMAMDELQPTVFQGTAGTPIQFLQNWLPGFVRTITAARSIDRLCGISTVGQWEDEEVVQGVLEPTGGAVPYGDYNNIPLSSWNPAWERRTVVRLEQGMRVGALEEARAARMNINTAAEKRGAAGVSLEIARNRVGFYGYNGGANRTYGFLNDPSLPAYVPLANGASASPAWASKTFLEITADINGTLASLQTQTKGAVDVRTTPITLALANSIVTYLATVSQFGNSVAQWLSETYPNVRVEAAPELDGANGGANVIYCYAEQVEDGATDDSRTWVQVVPAKFQMLGTEKQAKAYVEDYVSATAGVMLKRPYAVVRRTGA